jgi:hypothetical protein
MVGARVSVASGVAVGLVAVCPQVAVPGRLAQAKIMGRRFTVFILAAPV